MIRFLKHAICNALQQNGFFPVFPGKPGSDSGSRDFLKESNLAVNLFGGKNPLAKRTGKQRINARKINRRAFLRGQKAGCSQPGKLGCRICSCRRIVHKLQKSVHRRAALGRRQPARRQKPRSAFTKMLLPFPLLRQL